MAGSDFDETGMPSGMVMAFAAVAGCTLLALLAARSLLQKPPSSEAEDEKTVSGKANKKSAAKAPAKLPKKGAPASGSEAPVPQASKGAAVAAEDSDAEEELHSKSKKKKRKKPKGEEEVNRSLEDVLAPPTVEVDSEVLDGWTEVAKKRPAAEEKVEEVPSSPKQADSADAARKTKVADLRRRKVKLAQQLQRLEDSLSGGGSTGGKKADEQRKALEARAKLQDDIGRVNLSIQRLTKSEAASATAGVQDWEDAGPDEELWEGEWHAEWDGEAWEDAWQEGWEDQAWDMSWDASWHWDEVPQWSASPTWKGSGKRHAYAPWESKGAGDPSWDGTRGWEEDWQIGPWTEDWSWSGGDRSQPSKGDLGGRNKGRGKGSKRGGKGARWRKAGDDEAEEAIEETNTQSQGSKAAKPKRSILEGCEAELGDQEEDTTDSLLEILKGIEKPVEGKSREKGRGRGKGKGKGKEKDRGDRDGRRGRIRGAGAREEDEERQTEGDGFAEWKPAKESSGFNLYKKQSGERRSWGDAESSDEDSFKPNCMLKGGLSSEASKAIRHSLRSKK